MNNTQHVIQRVTFEMQIPSEDKSFEIQETISKLFNTTIQRSFEKLLDGLDNQSEVISIDKLEIDLGSIEDNVLEQELSDKIQQCLEEKLYQAILSARMNTGERQEIPVTIKPVKRSKLDLLLHFLKTGTMPWWARKEDRSVPVLVMQLLEESPAQLRETLGKYFNNNTYRKRIIYQLPDPVITEVMKLYDRSFFDFAADIVNDMRAMHARNNFTGLPEPAFRMSCWEYFIEQAFSGKTGTRVSEKADHLGALIKQLQPEEDAILFVIRKARKMQNEQVIKTRNLPDLLVIARKQSDDRKKINKDKNRVQQDNEATGNKNNRDLSDEKLRKAFLDENVQDTFSNEIYINNAGLVLVWPYILPLFRKLEIVNGNEFVSEEAKQKGAHLLQYLVTGETSAAEEHELVLNKLLCGIAPEEPLNAFAAFSPEERNECELLLENIITNWSALKKVSNNALRSTFLIKEGILKKESGWTLKIERTTVDMLIDKLPWGISIIMLPWNSEMIYVEW